jgi:hypothetical protein
MSSLWQAKKVTLSLFESASAAIAVATLIIGFVALGRRAGNRPHDLGVVSHQWIVQHREPPSRDAR